MKIDIKKHAIGVCATYFIVVLVFAVCGSLTSDADTRLAILALPVAAYVYWSMSRLLRIPPTGLRAANQEGSSSQGLSRYQMQLKSIRGADAIYRKRLFNEEEEQVFNAAIRCIANCHRRDLVVHGQVSLGEVIFAKPEDAFRAINSKRVDFLVSDRFGNIKFVIEHRGGGSFQKPDDYERNAVKHMALERAGIPIVATTDLAKAEEVIADAIRVHCR